MGEDLLGPCPEESERLLSSLQGALRDKCAVARAQGFLMGSLGCSPEGALERLSTIAADLDIGLPDVARVVVRVGTERRED